MTPNRITIALEKYGKQIPKDCIHYFKNVYLKEASDDCLDEFILLPIKGKTKTLLFSIFLGGFGADRFYLGDKKTGIAKLIFGLISLILSGVPILGLILSLASSIWCIADIFITYKNAKEINFDTLTTFLRKHKEVVSPSEGVQQKSA